MKRVSSILILALVTGGLLAGEAAQNRSIETVTDQHVVFEGLDGVEHMPLDVKEAKAHVLIFTSTDCPIANSYAPEIGRLVKQYSGSEIRFFLVHIDRSLSNEAAEEHRHQFSYELPILIDREHRLVKAVGASVTPEVAMINRQGRLVYRGCIDDLFANLGQKRQQPRHRYLRQAIEQLLESEEIATARTKAIGCIIQTD